MYNYMLILHKDKKLFVTLPPTTANYVVKK